MSLFPIIPPVAIPSVEFITSSNPGSANPLTFNDISIGTGAPTADLIVVNFGWNNGSAPSGLTVNGSATGVVNVNALSNGSNPDQARCAMYYFPAPSGSTCDLEISFSGSSPGGAGVTAGVYRIKGLRSHTPVSTDTDTASPMDWTLNVSKYACIVATSSFDNGGAGAAPVGLTRDYSGNHHGGHGQALAADAAYAAELGVAGGAQCGIAAAWR